VTDGQTDSRTDAQTMAKTREALHAVVRKNQFYLNINNEENLNAQLKKTDISLKQQGIKLTCFEFPQN